MVEADGLEARFLQLLIGSARFDGLVLADIADEKHAVVGREAMQKLVHLRRAGETGFVEDVEVRMAVRYLRAMIQTHGLFVLSTLTADEMNLAYLAEQIMEVAAADLVGSASAPPDGASELDLAWFFKLFSLRGMVEGVERMCFFAYLQKSDEEF